MIFNQQTADLIAKKALSLMTGGVNFSGVYPVKVVVYGGTQPSWDDYAANWTTDYWLDSASETVASNVLGVYGGTFSASTTTAVSLELVDENVITTANLNQVSEHFNDGTATWAVIWKYNESFDKTEAPTSKVATIVAVSDPAGQGTIKTFSTSVVGVMPNLSSVNMVFNI